MQEVLMAAKFEFFYVKEITLDYLEKYLNGEKREYFDENIEIIHIEYTEELTDDYRKIYNVLCKGTYR